MTLSDDEGEALAQFLESEVLMELSDQEDNNVKGDEYVGEKEGLIEAKRMRDEDEVHKEEGERVAKKMRVLEFKEGVEGEEEDGDDESREVKKLRDEKEQEEEDKLKELLPSSSSLTTELDDDVEIASLPSENCETSKDNSSCTYKGEGIQLPRRIESEIFGKIPSELVYHILKFLSSEDLIACSLVCRYLNYAASDEALWRRLYCMRWGLLPPAKRPLEGAWKKLYIQRDTEDMIEFVRNCPSEFKEYYIQMQAAKRSQAPLPSQVNDDRVILDKTVAEQVSLWKKNRGLTDKVVTDHACSGETCTYYQIGDVFVCEKTGQVHVCDDTCREVVADPANELLVCTISGHCFDRLLSPSEIEPDAEQQQVGVTDEAEPFMGSGRFARAYLLGYNCDDEKELEACLRFC